MTVTLPRAHRDAHRLDARTRRAAPTRRACARDERCAGRGRTQLEGARRCRPRDQAAHSRAACYRDLQLASCRTLRRLLRPRPLPLLRRGRPCGADAAPAFEIVQVADQRADRCTQTPARLHPMLQALARRLLKDPVPVGEHDHGVRSGRCVNTRSHVELGAEPLRECCRAHRTGCARLAFQRHRHRRLSLELSCSRPARRRRHDDHETHDRDDAAPSCRGSRRRARRTRSPAHGRSRARWRTRRTAHVRLGGLTLRPP